MNAKTGTTKRRNKKTKRTPVALKAPEVFRPVPAGDWSKFRPLFSLDTAPVPVVPSSWVVGSLRGVKP